MKIEEIRDVCTGCTACANICPKKCIEIKFDDEGFYYPFIDYDKCVKCKKCENVCHCINKKTVTIEKFSYCGFSLNEEIRKNSSSGGAFFAIAKNILNDNGKVYGAAFDYDDLLLKHMSSDDIGLHPLLKSKYIESYLGSVFSSIQEDVNNGKKVLFCGTPCQVGGLKQFINDPKHFLITCDFICHGIPSALLFKEYLSSINFDNGLVEIDFRPKSFGWSNKFFVLRTKMKKRCMPFNNDFFYKGFMSANAFLRRSCYDCKYRKTHHSDITIADFWGWKSYDKNINDEKGLSLIITNNSYGKSIIENLDNFCLKQIDNQYSDYAFVHKDYLAALPVREEFYKQRNVCGFKKAARLTYMKKHEIKYLKYIIKSFIKKIIKVLGLRRSKNVTL